MNSILLELKIEQPVLLELLVEPSLTIFPNGYSAVISAFDIAVKNGFKGTETEWLANLLPITLNGGVIF